MLTEGSKAPEFTAQTDDGSTKSLADYRGHKVILYFYPKDDTPGCTQQACDLRDRIQEIDARDTVVLGVSPDDPKSHRKFKEKYNLNFTLISDPDHKIAEAYGVWIEKSMYGRKYWGNERTTFIIDKDGNIAKVLPKVKPSEHAGQVLEIV